MRTAVVVLGLLISLFITAKSFADDRIAQLESDAQIFVLHLADQEFEDAVKTFDSTMTDALSTDKLDELWHATLSQVGAYKTITAIRTEPTGPYQTVFVTVQFEAAPLDIKVVYDQNDKIAGLFFAPAASTGKWAPPSYADTANVVTEDVTFGTHGWELPGTLYLPKQGDKVPGIVLVHGSGPQNRDESIGPNKIFKDIALGLVANGIAVLTYDKRTFAHGSKMTTLEGLTIDDEAVDDAVSAVKTLAGTPRIDNSKLYLLGHSLGGTMAPRIAEIASELKGIIIMAGTARPTEDLILDQMRYLDSVESDHGNPGAIDLQTIEQQVRLVKSAQLDSATRTVDLPLNIPASWWLSLRSYQPDRVASAINKPVLILQGMRDYQVTKHDLMLWEYSLGRNKNVTIKTYPNLNHLFFAGEGQSIPSEYNKPGHVDPQVITDIATWIKEH